MALPSSSVYSEFITTYEWTVSGRRPILPVDIEQLEDNPEISELLALNISPNAWTTVPLMAAVTDRNEMEAQQWAERINLQGPQPSNVVGSRDTKFPSFEYYVHPAEAQDMCYIFCQYACQHGVIFRARMDQKNETLRSYLAYLILRNVPALPDWKERYGCTADIDSVEEDITSLFEEHLLYDVHEYEGWKDTGRDGFKEQLRYYTTQKETIQMVLPAFPCKTTNLDKAASTIPDGAEYEALVTLQTFCGLVQEIYAPGCRIVIVSDGHVFSDCQGTDDHIVTRYEMCLREGLSLVKARTEIDIGMETQPHVVFRNLRQLLPLSGFLKQMQEFGKEGGFRLPNRPVQTRTDQQYALRRALLVSIWGLPPEYYHFIISKVPDHPVTALYRGFARFMFEDLAYHKDFLNATISQRKKHAERAAFEMIQRNQSYSRMVECLFPMHIRLSIHAHDNSGPKFAIRLVPFKFLRTFACLGVSDGYDAEKESRATLHIPTPWHSCIVQIVMNGQSHTYLTRSKIVRDALATPYFTGRWDAMHARGGRYIVNPTSAEYE